MIDRSENNGLAKNKISETVASQTAIFCAEIFIRLEG